MKVDYLFIDTEFNSYRGDLLSIALVPYDEFDPRRLYLQCDPPPNIDPWVAENVMPHITQPPPLPFEVETLSFSDIQERLAEYLEGFRGPLCIIADWPSDIEWFLKLVDVGPGKVPDSAYRPITFHCWCGMFGGAKSGLPHHAWFDAVANRDWAKTAGMILENSR